MKRSYFTSLIAGILILCGCIQLLGCETESGPESCVSDIKVLSHEGYYDTSGMVGSYVEIFGEVQNIGDRNLTFIKLTATLYDNDRQVIGTDYTYARADILLPGEKAAFSIMKGPTGEDFESYILEVTSCGETTDVPYRDFEFLNTSSYIDDKGYYCVKGDLKNIGTQNIDYVDVIITFYNTEGEVVSATSFLIAGLEASGIAPFDTYTLPDWISSKIASYSLQTDVSD